MSKEGRGVSEQGKNTAAVEVTCLREYVQNLNQIEVKMSSEKNNSSR